jgi:hypothetical protein
MGREVPINLDSFCSIIQINYFYELPYREDNGKREREREYSKRHLDGSANIDRSGLSEHKITKLSALQMVDAKMNSSHSLETRSHVGSHACQRLCYQSRHPSMQHLEWLYVFNIYGQFNSIQFPYMQKKSSNKETRQGRGGDLT